VRTSTNSKHVDELEALAAVEAALELLDR